MIMGFQIVPWADDLNKYILTNGHNNNHDYYILNRCIKMVRLDRYAQGSARI